MSSVIDTVNVVIDDKTSNLFRKAAILCVLQNVFFEDKSEEVRNSVTLHDNLSEKTGADSLESVEAIMKIEEYFDISIPEDEATTLVTLDKLLIYIDKKVNDFISTLDKKNQFYKMLNENISEKKDKYKLFENAKLLVLTDEERDNIENLKNIKIDFEKIEDLIEDLV